MDYASSTAGLHFKPLSQCATHTQVHVQTRHSSALHAFEIHFSKWPQLAKHKTGYKRARAYGSFLLLPDQ